MEDRIEEELLRLERRVGRIIGLIRFVVAMAFMALTLAVGAWLAGRGFGSALYIIVVPAVLGIWAFDNALETWLKTGR